MVGSGRGITCAGVQTLVGELEVPIGEDCIGVRDIT